MCGYYCGPDLRRCETWWNWGSNLSVILYDSSLKAEQTMMTSKPRTNFAASPSQLSFAGSVPLCLKSSLESSSDYHVGLVLALASGSVKRAPSSHVVGKPHSVAHCGTERSVHKVSSVPVQLDFSRRRTFLHLHPIFSNLPDLTRYSMPMLASI